MGCLYCQIWGCTQVYFCLVMSLFNVLRIHTTSLVQQTRWRVVRNNYVSCSFSENLAKSSVGAPRRLVHHLRGILDLHLGSGGRGGRQFQNLICTIGRSRTLFGPTISLFYAVLGKFGKIVCWHPSPRRVNTPSYGQ